MIFFRKLTVMNLTFRFIFQGEFLFSNNELRKSQLSVFSFISRQNYHLSLRCIRPGELSIYLQVVSDLGNYLPISRLYWIYLDLVIYISISRLYQTWGIIIYLQVVLDLGNYLSISRLYQTWRMKKGIWEYFLINEVSQRQLNRSL